MKKSIKNIKIVLTILTLCYFIAGCRKTDEDSLKFPKIVPSFTSTFDSTTGTAVFTSTSKFGNNYFWDFGDGMTSTQQNPMHTYTTNGDYTVTLKVTNSAGAVETITQTVHVGIVIPPTLLPITLPISFDAITVNYANITGFGTQYSTVTNPFLTGTNTSATKVAKIVPSGTSNFQGVAIPLGTAADFSGTLKTIKLQVYSTIATDILVKLTSGVSGDRDCEVKVAHGGTGWETLVFNFATKAVKSYIAGDATNGQAFVPTGSYKEIDVFVGFNLPSITSTFYIDDMMQIASAVVPPASCTADATQSLLAAGFNVTFSADPGTVAAPSSVSNKIISDNTVYTFADNPTPTSTVNPSCKVGKIVRTTGNLYGNSQIVLDSKIDFAANAGFKMKVFSPKIGSIIDVKLEDKAVGATNKEVQIPTTKANEWEELTFNFAATETNKYDRVVVFFDLGGNNADTYYFDDLKLYARTVTPPTTFNGGLLINGDFQAATSAPWIVGVTTTLAPTVTASGNTYYSVNVATVGNAYDVNLSQKLNITQGKTYTLTFDAWSSVNRSIIAGIGLSGGSWANDTKTQNITTTRTTYTLTLSAATFGATDARVLFDLGAAIGVVNIDNVSLVEATSGGGGGTTATFPVDFEGGKAYFTTFDDANITAALAANPSTTGNTSANVLKIVKSVGAHQYDGVQAVFGSNFDLTKSFSMQVYSTKANVVLRFEVSTSPQPPGSGNPGPVYVTVPTANTWTPVTFTFTGVPSNNVGTNNLVIKPDNAAGTDPNTTTTTDTYYIDNIKQP